MRPKSPWPMAFDQNCAYNHTGERKAKWNLAKFAPRQKTWVLTRMGWAKQMSSRPFKGKKTISTATALTGWTFVKSCHAYGDLTAWTRIIIEKLTEELSFLPRPRSPDRPASHSPSTAVRENPRSVALPREAIHLHCWFQNGTGEGSIYRIKNALRGAFFCVQGRWKGVTLARRED